jgi:predicted Zn-dependent protease
MRLSASLKALTVSTLTALCVVSGAALGATPGPLTGPATQELPDIGSPAEAVLSNADEYQIGTMIMREIRDSGELVDDPELSGYIQDIGQRLASHAQEGDRRFTFFVIKDPGVNAFAIPGGFVFVNAGLILATSSESELAGVLAHEISHVTQRHAVRGLLQQSHASLVSTAAMLAAILLGAASHNVNAGMAGVTVGQGAALQQQLNFSREDEYEADRIGIGVMANAGFDPAAMATFFETIGRHMGSYGENAKIIELLQTHPLSSARVAEAKNRAAKYPIVRPVDSVSYRLARERLRVLSLPLEADPHVVYAETSFKDTVVSDYRHFGRALALMQTHHPEEATPVLRDLVLRHPDVIDYHAALGQSLLAEGDISGSRIALARAKELFPRNIPITIRYAETLMRANDARLAHAVLLDLFNAVPPTQAQVRLIALAASAAGEDAEANYYMAEYHLLSGELTIAIETLRQALASPNITPVQRSRFKARIEELKEFLPPRLQAALERGEPLPSTIPNTGR